MFRAEGASDTGCIVSSRPEAFFNMHEERQTPSVTAARSRLEQYEQRRKDEYDAIYGPRASDPLARRLAKRAFARPLRMAPRLAATRVVKARERRKFRQLAAHRALRLHVGSGNARKEGWVNVDLAGYPVDVAWNLADPLPVADGTVEAIFHEHLLEHLTLSQGVAFTAECFRAIESGGVLRFGVPDAEAYARAYTDGDPDGFLKSIWPGRPTRLVALQELFFYPGHRQMYDWETARLVVEAAGFTTAERSSFGTSRIQPCPDSEHRRLETLYVEAVKDG